MRKGRISGKQKVQTSVRVRAIGHALIAVGGPAVMDALENGPRQWTEIQERTGLGSMALNRARRALLNAEMIVDRPIASMRKGSKAYELTELGKNLQKILRNVEKVNGDLPVGSRQEGTGT